MSTFRARGRPIRRLPIPPSIRARARRGQAGFSYIEVLVGIVLLAIVAGGIAQGLSLTSASLAESKVDTLAAKIASRELENVKRLSYDEVGTVGGNPEGALEASRTETLQNIDYLIRIDVVYVDDPALGQLQNFVNYKQVQVEVTPQTPDGEAVTLSTTVSPPTIGAISGKATAIVTVVDSVTGDPIPDVDVTIGGSTSPQRTDRTGADGKIVFAGLEPSALVATDPEYEYVVTAAGTGLVTHSNSADVRQHLAAAQTWQPTVEMFRPATIIANLKDATTGAPVTELAVVTATTPAPSSLSEVVEGTASSYTFTQIAGEPIEPSLSNFTVTVEAECHQPATLQAPVPSAYPTSLSEVFEFTLQRVTSGHLDVTVVDNATGAPIPGATVQVSGGAAGLPPTARDVSAAGFVRFCLEPSSGTDYIVAATAPGYGNGSTFAIIDANQVTPLTMRLVAGNTGEIRLTAPSSDQLVRLQALVGTYDVTQYTNSRRRADFAQLAPGQYMAYIATGFSGGNPTWSPGKLVDAISGQRTSYQVP